ncbi:MAG: glyoxalase [Chloroflexi bacterium]|nr:MAG: glyoxalase [Chloroflexota bacterium]
MRITGIDHVQLAMPPGEEDAARGFYAGILGMDEVAKPGPLAGRGGCWFETAGAVVHLGSDAGFAAATKAHPALLVEDIDATRTALRLAGAAVEDDDTLPGRRRLYTRDPFGNRLELIQDGDGLSQRRHSAG